MSKQTKKEILISLYHDTLSAIQESKTAELKFFIESLTEEQQKLLGTADVEEVLKMLDERGLTL